MTTPRRSLLGAAKPATGPSDAPHLSPEAASLRDQGLKRLKTNEKQRLARAREKEAKDFERALNFPAAQLAREGVPYEENVHVDRGSRTAVATVKLMGTDVTECERARLTTLLEDLQAQELAECGQPVGPLPEDSFAQAAPPPKKTSRWDRGEFPRLRRNTLEEHAYDEQGEPDDDDVEDGPDPSSEEPPANPTDRAVQVLLGAAAGREEILGALLSDRLDAGPAERLLLDLAASQTEGFFAVRHGQLYLAAQFIGGVGENPTLAIDAGKALKESVSIMNALGRNVAHLLAAAEAVRLQRKLGSSR